MTNAGPEVIDAGLVLSAVGSTGSGLVGADVDRTRGTVLNDDGRVTGEGQRGTYVVGWAKRGPSGSLGTNRECSAGTVQHLIEDALAGQLRPSVKERESLGDLLMRRGARVTEWSDWRAIDREEVRRGRADGRPREKLVDVQEALKVIDLARRAGGVQV
jgi:ferredoxin--NADP+ reductase